MDSERLPIDEASPPSPDSSLTEGPRSAQVIPGQRSLRLVPVDAVKSRHDYVHVERPADPPALTNGATGILAHIVQRAVTELRQDGGRGGPTSE